MARRIREHDWTTTPLGPIEGWPQNLRTLVDLVLASEAVMCLMWGGRATMVYSDSYAGAIGARHPRALGGSAFEVWADVRPVFEPLLRRAQAGQTAVERDLYLRFADDVPRPEAWFDLAYTPVPDGRGGVAGVLATLTETTERVLAGRERAAVEAALKESEEKRAFLLELSDALRPLTDPAEVQAAASRVVGDHLGTDRTYYVELDHARGLAVVARDYARGGAPSLAGAHPMAAFAATLEAMGDGRSFASEDAASDPRVRDADRPEYEVRAIRSFVSVPLIKGGELVAAMCVTNSAPRVWTPEEIALLEEVAERTWEAVERARAEEALRASEERYRTLVENVGDHAIFLLDADGRVTEWTGSAERVKGYSAEEVIGRHLAVFSTPEQVEAGDPNRELAEAAETGRAEREAWRVKKGGERIWVNEIATAVRDAEGNLVGFAKIARDLTERMRAEEALHEGEERYRLAVEVADLGRWELVPDTGEFYTSATCNRHLGLPEDARPTLEGHFENVHPDDHATIRDGLKRAFREGVEYEAEYRVIHPDGAVRRILSRARQSRQPGPAPDRLTGVTLDVTEARELEEERERARARELTSLAEAAERERISRELHDRVAHHMAVAHQSLELFSALREADPERAAERLVLARESTRVALDQTRALSAELKRLQEEELEGGIGAALLALGEAVSEGVAVEVSVRGDDSGVPKHVAMQAYLAMREAIRNAIRHSGCSRMGVALDVADGEVVGVVEDDGGGFDPEAVGKASPSWGVGLRSMRERAEMLGGSLRVGSAPGAGTRVEIKVPLDGRRP